MKTDSKIYRTNTGFTMLEIIVVVILLSVLSSLALPRYFRMVEYSRSHEALRMLGIIRQGMERCYFNNLGTTYAGCNTFGRLQIENPNVSPNSHFTYSIGGQTATGYTLTATRNAFEGGANVGDTVVLTQTAVAVSRSGTGVYANIQ